MKKFEILTIITCMLLLIFAVSCKKDDDAVGRSIGFYNGTNDSILINCNSTSFVLSPLEKWERIEKDGSCKMLGQSYSIDIIRHGDLTYIKEGVVTYTNYIEFK